MATETQKQWNDQWWQEVVHKRKHALPVLHNVRAKKAKKPKLKKAMD